MTTSGVELRRSLGLGAGDKKARKVAPAPRAPLRRSAAQASPANPAPRRAQAVPQEPGLFAVGKALFFVLIERLMSRVAVKPVEDRHVWGDTAKGLGLLLALTVQFCWIAFQDGATPFRSLYLMLNPMALPALMVACGLFAGRALGQAWVDYLPRKVLPFAAALLAWAVLQTAATWIGAPRGAMSIALAWKSLGAATLYLPLLLMVPAYLIVLRAMRNHFWFLAALAILAELLVIPGRTFGGELMRGLVFFMAGAIFSARFRMLAEEARKDVRMTIGAVAIFLALTALCVFIPMPYAGGAAIATLPFASLALGFSGAFCLIMAASLLAEHKLAEPLASIGRNWIAFAVAVPVTFGAVRWLLLATRTAPTPAAADIIIGVTVLAAVVAGLGLALFQRLADRPAPAPAQDEILPIRLR